MTSVDLLSLFSCFFIVFSVTSSVKESCNSPWDGTELVFAFMIHRHGDRTPTDQSLSLLKNEDEVKKIKQLIAPYGFGQLTSRGKKTGYKTGEFIRWRYDDIIAPRYNRSEMYIRTTDSTRVQMTVLTAMSAVYPAAKDNWSCDVNWDPIPYTTVPAKYDFNVPFINCPNYMNNYMKVDNADLRKLNPYKKLIQKVSKVINNDDIIKTPVKIIYVYDLYVSLLNLGYDIGDEMRKLMPEVEKAADVAYSITLGQSKFFRLQSGVFLSEFFKYANEIIANNSTQKVRVYAGHDFTVYTLEAICRGTPNQGVPKYGSLFSLELRRDVKTGRYYVLPVYLADPHEGVEKYLHVEGCGLLCDYDSFYRITFPFLLDEDTWRDKCGFTSGMTVDTSSID